MSLDDPLAKLGLVVQRATMFLPPYEAHGVVRLVSSTCKDAVHEVGVDSPGPRPRLTLMRDCGVRMSDGTVTRPSAVFTRNKRSWYAETRVVPGTAGTSSSSNYMVVGLKTVTLSGYKWNYTANVTDVWDRRTGTLPLSHTLLQMYNHFATRFPALPLQNTKIPRWLGSLSH